MIQYLVKSGPLKHYRMAPTRDVVAAMMDAGMVAVTSTEMAAVMSAEMATSMTAMMASCQYSGRDEWLLGWRARWLVTLLYFSRLRFYEEFLLQL